MKNKKKTRYLTELALLVAILLVMNITGLAMIPLPGQYASIMTVPVAIGAIILGPLGGGIMGFAMGAISFYTAVKTGFATLTMVGYTGGSVVLLSLINCFLPRILMGVLTGWIFRALKKVDKTKTICYYVGGLAAPVLNTVLYMSVLVAILMGAPMVENLLSGELLEKFQSNIFLFVGAYVGVQALLEAAVGCVLSGSICKVLRVVMKD